VRFLTQDLRFAVRALRRRPVFAAVAITTIAVGIGAATSIYSVVDGVLLRPLPFREPGKLVGIWNTFPDWRKEPILAAQWNRIVLSIPESRDLQARNSTFESIGIWTGGARVVTDGDRPELVNTVRASASLLSVLGVRPVFGRMFLPGEDIPNGARVAVVSYEAWQERYGGARDILGRVVHFDQTPFTIIGVLPEGFTIGRDFTAGAEFWTPVGHDSVNYRDRTNHSYRAVGRLKPGVTIEQAAVDVDRIIHENADPAKQGTRLVEWQSDQTRDARAPLLILLAAVGLLLLIACVNVATLLLGEASTREPEMAARLALGASRSRLMRQLLTESLTLAAAGAAVGTALAWWGTRILVALAPPRIPGLADVHMDGRVLSFALAIAATTGVAFGLAPALLLSNAGPASLLRIGTGQSVRGRGRLQGVMIAVELALSVVLLVGAGLLMRSFEKITSMDPGFRADHLLVVQPTFPGPMSRDSVAMTQFYQSVIDRLRALPGVTAVTATTQPPFIGGTSSSTVQIEGESEPKHEAQQRVVIPRYFATIGIPLVAGREFTADDRAGAPYVVVVSEALARRDFPNASPIGKRVRYQSEWRTIVGIVGDVRFEKLSKDIQPTIYTPFTQRGGRSSLSLLVRTSGDPTGITAMVRGVIADADSRIVLRYVDSMSKYIRDSFAQERYRATLISIFGALAALLAAVGMYGVTARAVARRAREVAIRVALGATEGMVVRQLIGGTIAGVTIGVVIGLVAAAGATRFLTPFLFGVRATDPVTYTTILGFLALVSLGATWLPARRVNRLEVANVLRSE
jgi:predicted permease